MLHPAASVETNSQQIILGKTRRGWILRENRRAGLSLGEIVATARHIEAIYMKESSR
jgi:hypothetical protein